MSTRQKANAARDGVIDRLRLEGLEAAYERAIKLLRDDDVPATAQANMVRTVFAAGGMLNAPETEVLDKEPHNMTAAEIDEAIVSLRRQMAERAEAARKAEDDDNVFD